MTNDELHEAVAEVADTVKKNDGTLSHISKMDWNPIACKQRQARPEET